MGASKSTPESNQRSFLEYQAEDDTENISDANAIPMTVPTATAIPITNATTVESKIPPMIVSFFFV